MRVAKNELRQRMRDQRSALSFGDIAHKSAAAAERVLALPEVGAASVVALYAPIPASKELATRRIHEGLAARGVRVAYPIVRRRGLPLDFVTVADVTQLTPSALGIPQPDAAAPRLDLGEIQAFVIPGLAFDRLGERLGWGQGHYDRTLSLVPAALRIGYAYDFQLVPLVPVGADDERVDVVVTESGTSPAQKGRTR